MLMIITGNTRKSLRRLNYFVRVSRLLVLIVLAISAAEQGRVLAQEKPNADAILAKPVTDRIDQLLDLAFLVHGKSSFNWFRQSILVCRLKSDIRY